MNKEAIEALKKWREEGGEIVRKTPDEKLKENPKSLRNSINAFCWGCSNHQRSEVANCVVKKCALYAVRPWQNKGGAIEVENNSEE